QLRTAYLEHDDSGEWARDSDTGGWAADDSGRWEAGVAYEDDDDRYRWVDAPAAWESGSEAGWDDEELDDLDEEEDELDPEPLAPRAREGRRPRSSQGRVGLRRTRTLLNTSTILLVAVGVLATVALSAWILSARLLTTR